MTFVCRMSWNAAVSMCMGLNVLSVVAICSALCFYYIAARCC